MEIYIIYIIHHGITDLRLGHHGCRELAGGDAGILIIVGDVLLLAGDCQHGYCCENSNDLLHDSVLLIKTNPACKVQGLL